MPRTQASPNSLPVPDLQRRNGFIFDRMDRYIGRLTKVTKPENVHRFRTHSRRVEALISEFGLENGNTKKLLKQLSKLRKKAGKVRDLDVQIAFLKELKVPGQQNHRTQLLEILTEEHVCRSRKLAKAFSQEKVRSIRKRLRKGKSEILLDGAEPLKLALRRLPRPAQMPFTEKMLHAWRIAAKQARYLAELAEDSPEAKTFVDELKRAQDDIGRWHDVLKLHQRAVRLFGEVHDSPLVSILQNLSRARFRQASNTVVSAVAAIAALQQPTPLRSRPEPGQAKASRAAAAAQNAA